MIRKASVNVDMLAVLDHYVLQNVSHVFAAIDGGFEKLVDFLEFDQSDRIRFLVEQVRYRAPANPVRLVLQTVDLDTMLHDGTALFQGFEGGFQRLGASGHNLGKLDHGWRNGVDPVRHQAVRGILYSIHHVIQRGRNVVNVFGIDRRDKRVIETRENLVDDLVAAVLQNVDFGGHARQAIVPGPDPFEQQLRCLRDDLHLFEEQLVKLLLPRQQSHK